jgi:hypothetical protein
MKFADSLAVFFYFNQEEEDAPREENDNEIQLHQTYRDKSATCRKSYIYCLVCHLNNEEKELQKDHRKVTYLTKTISSSI